MAIGGADSVVIRDPLTQEPIIPGSSIKGKMLSMTEKLLGAFQEVNMGDVKYGPYQDTTDEVKSIIPRLYGKASGREDNIPSRVIVRDANFTNATIEAFKNVDTKDMLYSEVKTEVVIDRVNSKSMPSQIERVPAGTMYYVDAIIIIFIGDVELN